VTYEQLTGDLSGVSYSSIRRGPAKRRQYLAAKWIPQGWQRVDPEKELKALPVAMRAGLISRSEAISAFGFALDNPVIFPCSNPAERQQSFAAQYTALLSPTGLPMTVSTQPVTLRVPASGNPRPARCG
jgi:hypothetical protein